MADRLVAQTRGLAGLAAAAAATAFWAQADLSGLERQSFIDIAAGAAFVTVILISPYVLAFFLAPVVRDQRWAQWLLVAVIIGAAVWMVAIARRPVPPQGRDGIGFLVVAIAQCIAVGSVRAASDLHRSRSHAR